MNPIQTIAADAAAIIVYNTTLDRLTVDDVHVDPLTADQYEQLPPEEQRKHIGAQLIAATLRGERRFDLAQAFSFADYRCGAPRFSAGRQKDHTSFTQPALMPAPTKRRHRVVRGRRKTTV